MIDAYATQGSYWRHLAPIVAALQARGHEVRTWSGTHPKPWGERLRRCPEPAPLALCASGIDAKALAPQRAIYVEHGAGQTYLGQDGYAGMEGLDHVALFLGPGEHVAARWRASYPQAAVEAIGCPALDQHHTAQPMRSNQEDLSSERPLVVVTAHWRCFRLPETMPALPYFKRGISELTRLEGIQLLGHAHPRAERKQVELWARLGIPFEPDPDAVLSALCTGRNALLVADNTSLMYEAAALGIPVLALNSPRYRRDVEHGLRFWSHVPGIQCDHESTLLPAVMAALDDPPEARALRARAAAHVYAHSDGSSARRAADAIERLNLE